MIYFILFYDNDLILHALGKNLLSHRSTPSFYMASYDMDMTLYTFGY